MFEDDETLRMYVDESLDHLGDIESDLLSIEQNGADIDVDLVNNVFRAAHSIKGGAGFMGLVTIKELSHSLENVLGLIREKELIPDSAKISVLLNGFDKLEEMLNNISESNDEDVSKHIELLSKITEASMDDEKREAVAEVVDIKFADNGLFTDISLYEIEQHMNEGKNIFIVEYDLINDIQLKNKNPLHVMQNIEKTGVIIDSKIDFTSIGTLDDDNFSTRIPFQILFSSIIEYDMASTLFEVDDAYIHLVTSDMIIRSGQMDDAEPVTITDQAEKEPEKPLKKEKEPGAEVKVEKTVEKEKVKEKKEKVKTAKPAAAKNTGAIVSSKPQTSLRVNVNLLDTLMNLAGELVLSRNQLLQGVNSSNEKATEQSSQRIDMITSELQEAIMKTRMQPIGNIFTKFTRIVRDMSRDLKKSIDLKIEGQEVELDKTILESINDPLTHLIRNSVDHGIETPTVREQKGKDTTGKIQLRAFHEAGQVNIEISDDGKGLDPEIISNVALTKGLVTENQIAEMSDKEKIELIFMAGFSTAEEITDVSGRGVGMDVVITNIETLGGIIELDSTPGKGTTTQIKLPLTLAIIPSQIAAVGDEKYAIPQVNLDELLRIPAGEIKTRVEKVGDASVVRLRGELLPLLSLSEVLGIEKTFINPEDDTILADRRKNLADRRSRQLENADEDAGEKNNDEKDSDELRTDLPALEASKRQKEDRRYHAASAINIAVVSAGAFKYGLVVDELLDSEEIVVKPVGRHLKKCAAYAGATIMGDGRVALILDISSLAQMADLTAITKKKAMKQSVEDEKTSINERVALLTFRNDETEHFAAPLNLVERIERIELSTIEVVGNRKVVQYRGGALPLYEISQAADVKPLPEREQQEVIVFKVKERELGLMVTPPVDALEITLEIDESTLKQDCISGSMIINKKTTLLLDIFEFMKEMNPEWFQKDVEIKEQLLEQGQEKTILFAEDSAFFRNQVKSFMTDEGFIVLEAEDGQIAWELLKERSDDIDIIVTDLEMPNMDGFELTKKIKETPEYSHYTVIALTSLASESHIQKGKKVGIDEYEIKLDREKLMKIIKQYLNI